MKRRPSSTSDVVCWRVNSVTTGTSETTVRFVCRFTRAQAGTSTKSQNGSPSCTRSWPSSARRELSMRASISSERASCCVARSCSTRIVAPSIGQAAPHGADDGERVRDAADRGVRHALRRHRGLRRQPPGAQRVELGELRLPAPVRAGSDALAHALACSRTSAHGSTRASSEASDGLALSTCSVSSIPSDTRCSSAGSWSSIDATVPTGWLSVSKARMRTSVLCASEAMSGTAYGFGAAPPARSVRWHPSARSRAAPAPSALGPPPGAGRAAPPASTATSPADGSRTRSRLPSCRPRSYCSRRPWRHSRP